MTAVRYVDVQCDECEEVYGVGTYASADGARSAARHDGWLIVSMSADRLTPRRDVCPNCRSAYLDRVRGGS